MIDWKIISAVLVTLVALLAALGNHPAVKGFFAAVGENLPSFGGEFTPGNISFMLAAEKQPLSAAARNVNITIKAAGISGAVKDVYINSTNKEIKIRGYSGAVAINNSYLQLNGSLERFEVGEVFVVLGDAGLGGSFERVEIENLAMREFSVVGSGVVAVDGNEISFSNGAKIENLLAGFVFADKLTAEGVAGRITAGAITVS